MCLTNFVLLFGFALLMIAFVIYANRQPSIALGKLINDLNGELSGTSGGIFSYEGQSFLLNYFTGQYGGQIEISSEGDFSGDLTIFQKEGLDGLLYNFIGKKVQIEDPSLRDFTFDCDDQAFVDEFIKTPEVQTTIIELLQFFETIEIDGNKCTVGMGDKIPISKFDRDQIHNAAHKILILMKHIPRTNLDNRS